MSKIPTAVDLHTILWVKSILHKHDIQYVIQLILQACNQAEKQYDNHYKQHIKDNVHKIRINREDKENDVTN